MRALTVIGKPTPRIAVHDKAQSMTQPTADQIPPYDLAGICDCHVHVYQPALQFPFWPGRHYTPADAPIEAMLALHRAIGVERAVIVHPSPYGTDNASLLWLLGRLGASARGVAVIDEHTTGEELATLHLAGVRGTRLNLETRGQRDPDFAREQVLRTVRQTAHLGWHVQLFVNLSVIEGLHDTIMSLPSTVVFDHFGRLDAAAGLQQPGLDALLSLVRAGRAYVKLSAPYRVSELPDYGDVAPYARALIEANPDRMVWGSDWPNSFPPKGAVRKPEIPEPFRVEDNLAALRRLVDWAGTAACAKKILVDNPARLYDF